MEKLRCWAAAAGGTALLLILATLVWTGRVLAKAMQHEAALVLLAAPSENIPVSPMPDA